MAFIRYLGGLIEEICVTRTTFVASLSAFLTGQLSGKRLFGVAAGENSQAKKSKKGIGMNGEFGAIRL